MNFLAKLAAAAEVADLKFLLIGGNAVMSFGSKRTTKDVDLMIDDQQLQDWTDFLVANGYELFRRTDNFVQFTPPAGELPLDLMLVSESTWTKLFAARETRVLEGNPFEVPSALHIIALKLHALKQNPTRDTDWKDIDFLIASEKIDVRSTEFQDIVKRYGSSSAYGRILSKNHPSS